MAADQKKVAAALKDTPLMREISEMPDVPEEGTDAGSPGAGTPAPFDAYALLGGAEDEEGNEDEGTPSEAAQGAEEGAGEPEPDAPAYTPDQVAAWQREAQEAQNLQNLISQQPDTVAAYVFNRMTPAQQQAFLAAQGMAAPTGQKGPPLTQGDYQIKPDEYAEMTPPERLAWDNGAFLLEGPKHIEKLRQDFGTDMQQLAGSLVQRDYEIELLREQVAALSELAEVKLPEPDAAGIEAALRAGKSLRDAVKEVYGTKARAAAAEKRAPKRAARTPGNTSNGQYQRLRPDASLAEQMKAEAAFYQKYGRMPTLEELL